MEFVTYHFGVLDSTMDKAREIAIMQGGHRGRRGNAFLVTADLQTRGRGRMEGRRWEGAFGASLLMTLAMENTGGETQTLPLKLALALLDNLARPPYSFGRKLKLKWPNDLIAAEDDAGHGGTGRTITPGSGIPPKLAGVLCEGSGSWFFGGIGLNLRADAFPAELRDRATSLGQLVTEAGRPGMTPALQALIDPADNRDARNALAKAVATAFMSRLGDEQWHEAYRDALWMPGEMVVFSVGHPVEGSTVHGWIEGVDEQGMLILRGEDGTRHRYLSGEISARRSF